MHRLFVGLRPPPAVRRLLLDRMGGVADARWQDDDQLHLTLRFVGEVDRRAAEDIAVALSGVRAPAPEIALGGVGMFDQRGRVTALWAGVAPHAALAALHRKVDHAIARAGQSPERRAYLPHITLARLRAPVAAVERFLAINSGLSSDPFCIEHMTLFESTLGSEGARYEAVERFPLGG